MNKQVNPFIVQSSSALQAKEIAPIKWAIPELIPEGLTVIAGKPKMGKSWLMLSIALAVANGGMVLGKIQVEKGRVLYLALEDHERRMRGRQDIMGMTSDNLDFVYASERINSGFADQLNLYLDANPDTRLVIVDTLAKVSPISRQGSNNAYGEDYATLGVLKDIADTRGIAIMAVHHTRKTTADDAFDEISGSVGVFAAVDTAILLKRGRNKAEAVLSLTGRDVNEQDIGMTFNAQIGTWTIEGNAAILQLSNERQEVIDLLKDGPMRRGDMAKKLGLDADVLSKRLNDMAKANEVRSLGGGSWALGVKLVPVSGGIVTAESVDADDYYEEMAEIRGWK